MLHVQGGVVMVDDYFAEGWPGVSEGVHTFMLTQSATNSVRSASGTTASGTPRIVPFFVGFNKVLFTGEEFSGTYQDALMSNQHLIGQSLFISLVVDSLSLCCAAAASRYSPFMWRHFFSSAQPGALVDYNLPGGCLSSHGTSD